MAGAKLGGTVGTMIAPGIGTAIGAGLGGIVGAGLGGAEGKGIEKLVKGDIHEGTMGEIAGAGVRQAADGPDRACSIRVSHSDTDVAKIFILNGQCVC